MLLDNGTIIGIIIALLGSLTMMIVFWRENANQHKQIRRLQVALREARKNND